MLKKTGQQMAAIIAIVMFAATADLYAVSFTEQFNTAVFKDVINTTADWDTTAERAILQRVSRFAQTVDVISWGGGITAIEYSPDGKWLLGGLSGKINEYDGSHFINRTQDLKGFGKMNIRAIKQYSGKWFVAGDGPRLNEWDGEDSWTDITGSLKNFTGNINAVGHPFFGGYWMIGGDNGCLNIYDGISTWYDMKTALNFGPYHIKAIGNGGGYWLIAGTGGKIIKYNGVVFTDITAALNSVWGGTYDVYSMDYNGLYWVIGGGGGKIATYDGTTFTNRDPGGTAFYTVWAVKWTGSYWLIGGCQGADQAVLYSTQDATIVPYTEQTNPPYFSTMPVWAIGSNQLALPKMLIGGGNGRLMKREGTYNTAVNSDLSRDAVDFGANAINCAVSNGSYWLIGGAEGALNRYDGIEFTDLRPSLGWATEDIMSVAWNSPGNYWLIGGKNGKLAKYDGSVFSDRSAALGFGTDSVKTVKWNGTQWLIGGEKRKLAKSDDGDIFSQVDISSYFGPFDSVNALEWNASDSLWYAGGGSGSLLSYDGFLNISGLTAGLNTCLGGYYEIYSMKYDEAGKLRIGCASAKMADYEIAVFTNMSGVLVNFGTASIYTVGYEPGLQMWMIGGNLGKVNISFGAGAFTDESDKLVSFSQAAVNAVSPGPGEWLIAGDNAKLNRWGISFMPSGWVYSGTVDSWFAGYGCTTLTAAYVLNGQDVNFWLSANNGATWLPSSPGSGVCFSGADNGTSLRWRAFIRTYDEMVSPYIDTVILDFTRKIAPTYTFTATSTYTKTATVTPTWTRTATGTFTPSVTATQTKTYTPTVTGTATQTITQTATGTPTFTVTATGTATSSVTETRTATGTATPTQTGTRTITKTVTETVTPTLTITMTFTDSPTYTETSTVTVSFTVTPSFTVTRTFTETPTVTRSFTVTETWTASPTFTYTATFTGTPSVTMTYTKTLTYTVSETRTATGTRTITPSITATASVTCTPAATAILPGINETIIYPNPASDRINVSFYMKEEGSVKMRIYNEAGDLAAITDEMKPAGNGTAFIDSRKMAPGVYFCLISLNYTTGRIDKFGIKKLLIIKAK